MLIAFLKKRQENIKKRKGKFFYAWGGRVFIRV